MTTITEPDLHTRLRSAIEERLALAQAATPGPWHQRSNDRLGDDDTEVCTRDQRTLVQVLLGDQDTREEFPQAAADARFIAANSPDWVIRACRADLARLERHRPQDLTFCEGGVCWACDKLPPQPCPEVRSLAEVWEVEL